MNPYTQDDYVAAMATPAWASRVEAARRAYFDRYEKGGAPLECFNEALIMAGMRDLTDRVAMLEAHLVNAEQIVVEAIRERPDDPVARRALNGIREVHAQRLVRP